MKHMTMEELTAGMEAVRSAPQSEGILELIVRRPKPDARELLQEGRLDLAEGLVGDTWRIRKSSRTIDGSPHPDMQLNIMNARAAALVAVEKGPMAARRGSTVHRYGLEHRHCRQARVSHWGPQRSK
jgi:hypothetical protein